MVCMYQQAARSPLIIAPVGHPKRNTWYYGMRCACSGFLTLCEDLFLGRGVDDLYQAPGALAVRCACGKVNPVQHLQKFKQP